MNPEASSTPDPSDDADTEAAAARTEAEDPGAADLCLDTTDADVQNRLWLKAVVPLLQLRNHETDPSARVQFAFDQMYIAACERVARILRGDLSRDAG